MIRSYFKIAWRNLIRHRSSTLINLTGLAVGMACCILIALYMREELSYDTFHDKSDRIAVAGSILSFGGEFPLTPFPLADALREEVPEVVQAARTSNIPSLNLSRDNQQYSDMGSGLYTDSAFLEIFSFELIHGDPSTALEAPNSIVLSERSSRRLFGPDNPVGRSLYWQQQDTLLLLQVSGVVENAPAISSIQYDALVSIGTKGGFPRQLENWTAVGYSTYALLKSPDSFDRLPEQIDAMVRSHLEPNEDGEYTAGFFMMPLTDLHLAEFSVTMSRMISDQGFTGNINYLYLFGSIALFILIIACVNYVNLATARASLRSREVGVRKTLGAVRSQVAGQFIGESLILSTAAYLLGCVLALAAIPWFNQLFGTSLTWQASSGFLLGLVFVSMLIGVAAGLYPSLYLSKFTPASVLSGHNSGGSSGSLLRKILVVGQFAIALVLIISSLILYQQLEFTRQKDLGFDGEQVVSVALPGREGWNNRERIAGALRNRPGIEGVTIANASPGRFNFRLLSTPSQVSSEARTDSDDQILYSPAVVDVHFLDLLDIHLLAGRNFSTEMGSDAERGVILNAKGAKMLGWTPEEAIGKPFRLGIDGEVIGVVENFHISSLHTEIEGVVLQMRDSNPAYFRGASVMVLLAPDQIENGLDQVRQVMAEYTPSAGFQYEFLDDRFDAMYRTEQRLGQIVGLFTVIAIIIACLGLYGLAAFSAEQRIREIGIRKVMGATIGSIVTLLSKDFLKLVLLGFVIAVPIAWYAMNDWLSDFAYRIEIGPAVFLLAGGAAVMIALVTVSWQSMAAARMNPVESLRTE